MQYQEEITPAKDGHEIPVYIWKASSQVNFRGVLQIVHGLAEHAARYSALAATMTAQGYTVIAHDHRGHGRCAQKALLGHYDDHRGWNKVVADLDVIYQQATSLSKGMPHFLLAHSMGSFITMQFLMDYPASLTGVILSGSNYSPPLKYRVASKIASLEKAVFGGRHRSKLLDHLSFGSFNGHFKPARTSHDWLSRDIAQVDLYLQDPACGFIATTQLWCDFLDGLANISRPTQLKKINGALPFFLLAGERDPVGHMGDGVMALSQQLKAAGIKDITCTLYPEGRHEMLNETNAEQVQKDIWHWIQSHVPATESDTNKSLQSVASN